jgi:hypothetical protein
VASVVHTRERLEFLEKRRKVSADFEATIHAGRANPMMFFVMK